MADRPVDDPPVSDGAIGFVRLDAIIDELRAAERAARRSRPALSSLAR